MEELVFKGVAVYVDLHDEKTAPRVRAPHFTSVGGQVFLSGTLMTAKTDHWAEGKAIHIPLNRIKSLIELGDENDVAAFLAKYQAPTLEKDTSTESGSNSTARTQIASQPSPHETIDSNRESPRKPQK